MNSLHGGRNRIRNHSLTRLAHRSVNQSIKLRKKAIFLPDQASLQGIRCHPGLLITVINLTIEVGGGGIEATTGGCL
jgi:hypothetical protein